MSRIIAPDSPLSRLPAGLYPPQKGWIDGIRYSVDIADIAMHRLCADLQELTRRSIRNFKPVLSRTLGRSSTQFGGSNGFWSIQICHVRPVRRTHRLRTRNIRLTLGNFGQL
jgi:hypothetical protein